jgi:peptide/nickel transport system substrate-binding protein
MTYSKDQDRMESASRRSFLMSASAVGLSAAAVGGLSITWPLKALAQDGNSVGTIVVGNAEPPTANYWDPAAGFGLVDEQVASLVYDTLIAFDENGDMLPSVATAWEWTSDRSILLTLRTDVKFHDGSALRAEDIKASLDRLGGDGGLAQSMVVTKGFSVDIQSPDKIEVSSPVAFGVMLNALAFIKILPQTNIDNPDNFKGAAIGSGPYTFVSYEGNDVVLAANPDYFGGAPKNQSVVFRYIEDAQARISALLTGQVDILSRVGSEDLARVEGNDDFRLTEVSPPSQIVAIYQHNGPLGNVKVRQALAHAIDREGIAKNIMGGANKVGFSSIPTNAPYYVPFDNKFEYDPEKAKGLLAEAGFGDGLTLRMSTSTLVPNQIQIDQVIAASLQAIGITVEVERLEVGAFRTSYNTYDINLNTLASFNNDADFILGLYTGGAGEAIFHYSDPEFDKLHAAQRAASSETRANALSAAAKYLWDNQVTLYLYDEFLYFIVYKRVDVYKRSPLLGEALIAGASVDTL